jgi:hypothetical protein
MKNLLSNTAFGNLLRTYEQGFKIRLDYLKWYEALRNNYDDFLKQPLELWMFVPCKLVDSVWVVLEVPKLVYEKEDDNSALQNHNAYLEEFQQAKERCLFDGCVYDDEMQAIRNEKGIDLFYLPKGELFTIEIMTKYNLQLTTTVKKQIGL